MTLTGCTFRFTAGLFCELAAPKRRNNYIFRQSRRPYGHLHHLSLGDAQPVRFSVGQLLSGPLFSVGATPPQPGLDYRPLSACSNYRLPFNETHDRRT